MSSSIIKVRDFGKSYNISHEGGKENYTAFRDVVASKAKKIFSFPESLRTEDNRTKATVEEFWALKDVCFVIKQGDRIGNDGRNDNIQKLMEQFIYE
jgi:ABC-type polysaccharide/polyol phosphate transport system ATPase subunit